MVHIVDKGRSQRVRGANRKPGYRICRTSSIKLELAWNTLVVVVLIGFFVLFCFVSLSHLSRTPSTSASQTHASEIPMSVLAHQNL